MVTHSWGCLYSRTAAGLQVWFIATYHATVWKYIIDKPGNLTTLIRSLLIAKLSWRPESSWWCEDILIQDSWIFLHFPGGHIILFPIAMWVQLAVTVPMYGGYEAVPRLYLYRSQQNISPLWSDCSDSPTHNYTQGHTNTQSWCVKLWHMQHRTHNKCLKCV